jgi:lipopolysaccharide transport system ATP-binding protein
MLEQDYDPASEHSASVAIVFSNVTKSYLLFNSLRDQAIAVLGLKLPFMKKIVSKEFSALKGINLEVRRGEQVGLIGRNGAGKTSLLKLLTGNFEPTSGTVSVDGNIQALMQMGLGFYPEFTGYENLRSSLEYNGINESEFDAALSDAINFVELGEHLHQPFKTYSLGMRSRLQFAAATAIRPDILIVDEVLGAGDAYFSGKSAARMKRLTSSGCTLLLVSHSMQQILQFCQRCVWIESGRIVMDGAALPVIRAYEEYTRRLEDEAELARSKGDGSILADEELQARLISNVKSYSVIPETLELDTTNVPRWPAEESGLKISRVRLLDSAGHPTRLLRSGEPASFELDVVAELDRGFDARFALVIFREDGFIATRLISDTLFWTGSVGKKITVVANMGDVLLGGARYVVSAQILKYFDPERPDATINYDLVARCFEFRVVPPSTPDLSMFHQRHTWAISRNESE